MEKINKNQLGALIVIIGVLVIGVIAGYAIRDGKADCPEVPEQTESIFDVNRDKSIDAIDVIDTWRYVSGGKYPLISSVHFQKIDLNETAYKDYITHKKVIQYAEYLYDVNCDGTANWNDVHLIWEHIE